MNTPEKQGIRKYLKRLKFQKGKPLGKKELSSIFKSLPKPQEPTKIHTGGVSQIGDLL